MFPCWLSRKYSFQIYSQDSSLFDKFHDRSQEWTQIVNGENHKVGLTANGEVYTWGHKLGHRDENQRDIPTKVTSLNGVIVTQVACGQSHSAALTDKGDLFTWYVRV